jgi:hypothetical protein
MNDADVVRRRKLMACLLLAVEEEPDAIRPRWRLVIRRACRYADLLEAAPAEFNQLLGLTVKELLGGTNEERRPERADERGGEHEQAG